MSAGSPHPLATVLVAAADGRFPPVDGAVEVLPPHHGTRAVVEFTGHSYVLTDLSHDAVVAVGAHGFGGATHPSVLLAVAAPDAHIGSLDVVLFARGVGGGFLPPRDDLRDHPRVDRAHRYRRDVAVHGDERGLVTLGRGLADRLELSVERFDGAPAGVGRGLISEGLAIVPAGQLVWAQVSPGNAASLRAFLAAGFTPVGSEVLITGA